MAVNNFDACMAETAKWEGGWSDHAADRGGKTNWGITQATLGRALGRPASAAEIRALTKDQAKAIYKRFFWDGIGADGMPKGVDLCCFDWGVNSGESRGKKAYADVRAKLSNPAEMVKAICAARRGFFSGIIARNPSQAVFRKGWFNRVAGIEATAYKWALMAVPGAKPADVSRKMQTEASTAAQKAKTKAGQAKAAGGTAGAGGVATSAGGWNWEAIIFGGVCVGVLLFIAFLIWRSGAFENARKEAFQEVANNA